ncbi:MAG: hypothetical protein Q9165_007140 [Trypethelium subeluteriae]
MAASPGSPRGIPPPADGLSAARVAFPRTIYDFENDPRVSFSKLDNKYILEDDDGSEWEWQGGVGPNADLGEGRWLPLVDADLLEQQQQAYAAPEASEKPDTTNEKKRKHSSGDGATSQAKQHKAASTARQRKNTAIYISKLPLDTDEEEVRSTFSRFGIIADEIDSGKPRIKLYTDENGNFKGDALVVYFKPESIQIAIDMMDRAQFRPGVKGTEVGVKEADFSYKRVKTTDAEDELDANNAGKDPKNKAHTNKDIQKIKKRTQAMNNKLADWDDDDPQVIPETSSRLDKVVVLKHMFTLDELAEDSSAVLDIKEDVREECAKLGDVTNVVLYDQEPDGVITVRFGNAASAKACVRKMDGRYFSMQTVEAYIATGQEKFKKSIKKAGANDEDEDTRLDEFGDWLEGGHDTKLGDEIR